MGPSFPQLPQWRGGFQSGCPGAAEVSRGVFDPLARLFLLQEIDQSVFVAILELRWVKVTRLRLYDVGSQIEHFLRQFQLRDVLEIWLLIPNLVRITQRRTYKAPALRLERDHMLAPRQHHPTERDHVQLCNG